MSNQATEIKEKILELEQALLEANPTLPTMLRTIHTALRNDPEIVTLLSEEDISIVVRGLMKQTQTVIAESVAKAKPKKALSKMTLEDL
jgi:hypothetical protein